jgi:trk system potassium uptake protein TrkH
MRHSEYLRHRYRIILGYTGLLSLVICFLILSPLTLLVIYPQETALAWGFVWPGLGLVLLGALFWRFLKPRERVGLSWPEGTVIVVLAWLLAVLGGAIPFMVVSRLNFTQAIFEATSGWTTAGLSVVEVSQSAHLILFFRSVMQLAGGAGLAIIMLSALAGPVGSGLSAAEGRSEQLLPHVRQSAKLVLTLYTGYVLVGMLALYLAGMDWFDAVNHAFAALSTGGFSTRPVSIGYWDSPAVEAVTIILMLLGTLNFLTAYTFLQKKFKVVGLNGEVQLSALLILLGVTILLLGLTIELYPTWQKSVRVAIFETVTALSTTGFATVDYRQWNDLGWFILIILMLVGGGTGSTAGGIKQYRIYVLYRGLLWEFRRKFLPRSAVTQPYVWQGEQKQFLNDTHLRQVSLFVFLFLVSFLVGSGLLAAYGYPLRDSLFEFASALGTVGLSVGITAADAPAGVLWIETLGMFLGRLEFFTIFVGLGKILADVPTLLSKDDLS